MNSSIFRIFGLIALSGVAAQGAMVWTVGLDDNGWPVGDGGGANTTFVQEGGNNPLPGVPNNPEVNQQSDDDYYFAGEYNTVLDGGTYTPLGIVSANEEGAERAFVAGDSNLRYHFNLPATIGVTDLLSVTFDANNLDNVNGTDLALRRYGVEVYFNGNLVMSEVQIYDPGSGQANWTAGSSVALLDDDITTPTFTLGDVNGMTGAGFDNYVELRGINYNASGGGNWMGVDYVQLDANPIPEPSGSMLAVLGLIGLAARRRRR
jgi:hypothetical protein